MILIQLKKHVHILYIYIKKSIKAHVTLLFDCAFTLFKPKGDQRLLLQ